MLQVDKEQYKQRLGTWITQDSAKGQNMRNNTYCKGNKIQEILILDYQVMEMRCLELMREKQ